VTAVDTRAESWAAHIAHQHWCCWVVGDDPCGLWCGHDGEHLPYAPGDYLSAPIVDPIAMWRLRDFRVPAALKRCPICGSAGDRWGFGLGIDCSTGLISRQVGDEIHLSTEAIWRFWPCGCEGREILPD